MEAKFIFLNGELIQNANAKIHVSDLSIQRAYGIFDFLKTINYHPVFMDDYLNRFYHSAQVMELTIPYQRDELKEKIHLLIQKNDIPNSGIKLILTGGYSTDGYHKSEKPNFMMIQTPLNLRNNISEEGLHLISHAYQRQIPSVKTIDYLQAIKMWSKVEALKADDLLYHQNNKVRECPRANIFMVKGNRVFTPKTNILQGITRSKVLNFSDKDLKIQEKDFTLNDLCQADEAFVTVTTKNICPIYKIDNKLINDGKIGKITRTLQQKLLQLIDNDIHGKIVL